MALSRLTRSLITRYPLPMVRRSLTTTAVDADNPFSNATESYVFVRGQASDCTLQAVDDNKAESLPEGVRKEDSFTIYSTTPLYQAVADSNEIADALYIPDSFFELNGYVKAGAGGWYTVVSSKIHNNLQSHCEAVITKDLELKDGALDQYPDLTVLGTLVDTRAKLVAGSWLTAFEAENV